MTAVILLAIGVTIAVQRSDDDLMADGPAGSGALDTPDPVDGQPTSPPATPVPTDSPTTTPTAPGSSDPTAAPTDADVADQLDGVDGSTSLPNTGGGMAALGLLSVVLAASGTGRRRPL
ncbi:MAG: hypothetical protein R3246_14545 [Acidimicrobiia bacterium]|nr:hypothetical protein [Acidimicrobiia bacterium]